jgi:hypothetical protein
VARLKSKNRAQFFSAESGTASAAAWKPILEWVPSQNGFFVDVMHRAAIDVQRKSQDGQNVWAQYWRPGRAAARDLIEAGLS